MEKDTYIIQEAPQIGRILPISKLKNKETMKAMGLDSCQSFAAAFCSETTFSSFLKSILDWRSPGEARKALPGSSSPAVGWESPSLSAQLPLLPA